MRMFKQQVKLVFFLSIRKMRSLLPSHKQLFLGNTICNALYEFLMSLPCIPIQIIQIFSSLQADQQARCVNQSKKNLMLIKQVISLPAMEALTVNNISRQHASPFEFQLFHLELPLGSGKNVKINFGLTLTKFHFSYSCCSTVDHTLFTNHTLFTKIVFFP